MPQVPRSQYEASSNTYLIALLGDQVYSCEKHIASAREMRYDCYSMISCPLCESIKVEE